MLSVNLVVLFFTLLMMDDVITVVSLLLSRYLVVWFEYDYQLEVLRSDC